MGSPSVPDRSGSRTWRRLVGCLTISIVVAFHGVAVLGDLIWDFLIEHDGVGFFRRHPALLGLCLVCGVLGGLALKVLVAYSWLNRTAKSVNGRTEKQS